MQQVLFRIPIPFTDVKLPIFGFGVMLCLAFLLCTWMAGRRARRAGMPPETMQDLAIWLFVCGLLGARLTFLLQEDPRPGFWQILYMLPRIWDGGIILYGSAIGGLIGYLGAWYFIFRPRKIGTLALADVAAPAIALGLCLGRIGCFLNGCCYGQVACPECAVWPVVHFPVSAPPSEDLIRKGVETAAGFTIVPAEQQPASGVKVGVVALDSPAWRSGLRAGDVIVEVNGQPLTEPGEIGRRDDVEKLSQYLRNPANWQGRHDLALTVKREGKDAAVNIAPFVPRTVGLYPAQLYESVSMILLILFLLAYEPFRRSDGQVMALLLLAYGIHRFLNEMLRADPRPEGFERYTSLALAGVGLAMWLALQLRSRRAAPAPKAPVAATASA
jgi:phosphatidylglycerol:prolipoprotein diacylglycerol transferase